MNTSYTPYATPETQMLDEIACETCSEWTVGNPGARCPLCCTTVESLWVSKGIYQCPSCKWTGSIRLLKLELVEAGRLR